MILQTSPNNYSCVPYAFAMVIDMDANDLIAKIGKNGAEIWYPESDHPERGFFIADCVLACLDSYHITEVAPVKCEQHVVVSEEEAKKIIKRLLEKHNGVLALHTLNNDYDHAVAWDHEKQLVYDPMGAIYPLRQDHDYYGFWIIERR